MTAAPLRGPQATLTRRADGGIDYLLEVPCTDACYGAGAVTRLPDPVGGTAALEATVTYAAGRMCAQTITIVRFAGTIADAPALRTILFRIIDQRSGRKSELSASLSG
jgi:hypothetical protein